MYRHSLVFSVDDARRLADCGVPEAMYSLAVCYLLGRGVEHSLALSRFWARRCEELISQRRRAPAGNE